MDQLKPSGLLLIDKPIDWTSFDVVNKVRFELARQLDVKPKAIKVGHSGTLDPKASGLLVLAVGSTTKQLEKLIKQDKTYEVGATLGSVSTTGDSEGDISVNQSTEASSEKAVKECTEGFVGVIEQKPHRFSAIKVDGVRAYKLARSGKEVNLMPRQVTIYSLDKLKYNWPQLNFDVKVSSGTYIRSLVEDIGQKLGVGAYTTSLRRTQIGNYSLHNACEVEDIDYETIIERLLPLDLKS